MMRLPFSGSKKAEQETSVKSSDKQALAQIFLDLEDGGDMFLRNVG
jgi:hypothetical protein